MQTLCRAACLKGNEYGLALDLTKGGLNFKNLQY